MGLAGAFLVDTALLLVPALACALLAARFGVTHWLLLLTAAVSGSGTLALAVFWVYLASSHAGRAFSLALTGLSVLVLLDACRHGFKGWRTLRPLLPVGVLWMTAGFFSAALAYLHVSFASNSNIAPMRFRSDLPADNVLPMLFAKQLEIAHRPLPPLMVRGWQTSDRPPLQTGYYLMQQSVLHSGHFNDYELLGIMLQCLWIPGLWALLVAMGKPRRAVALCLAAVLFNGFIFQNTVFTWPKLIAAAALLLMVAMVCTRQAGELLHSRTAGVLVGLAAGTAMMSHPGSSFAMIGFAGVIAVMWVLPKLRPAGWRPPNWRFLWPSALALGVCYEPWSAYYTKHYQPPASALTELQLAGIDGPVPHKTTTQVIVHAYKKVGVHGAIENKIANFKTPFIDFLQFPRWCLGAVYHELTGHPASAAKEAAQIVHAQFFYIGTIVGVFCIGLAVLYGRALIELVLRVIGRAGADRPLRLNAGGYGQEYVLLAVIGLYWIGWCVVLFGPWSTIAHQGTYFTEPVLIALGVLGFWSISRKLAAAAVFLSSVFTVWLYIEFTPVATVKNSVWLYNPGHPFTLGVLGIKALYTGGSNTDPATTGARALLVLSLLLCVAALWWVSADKRMPAAVSVVPGQSADGGRRRRIAAKQQLVA